MRGKQSKLDGGTVRAAGSGAIRCAHRKVITRINGEGRYLSAVSIASSMARRMKL